MHFRWLKKTAQDVFISDPIDCDSEGNSLTLQDMADEDNIFERIDLRLKSEKMYQYLKKHLSARERKTLIMRYGLCGEAPMTQREVAQTLNISRSYVSRIEKRAIQTLRRHFIRDGFSSMS
jgi:RNA polymerase sporulation-specific sigma factor